MWAFLWAQIVHLYWPTFFLFYYDYNYMKKLIKQDLWAARRFNNTMRCIDDLLTLNNRFECAIDDIRISSRASVQNTTECPTSLSYLDIMITIDNGKYSMTVYDKGTASIVNFPHLCSNIPSKPAYGVYIFQLVRISRICNSFVQFKRDTISSHRGSSIKDFGMQDFV